jgi:hypothetical protein
LAKKKISAVWYQVAMGGGGLMQLVAYGAQDIYLTGSPQITFFKTIYRRHTNFAIESIEQTFTGTVGFGKRLTTTISRNGDLITDVVLEITLKKNGDTFYPAEALLEDIELEIGGQRIDKHYADWFRIYDSLFRKNDEQRQYRRMTDFVDGESTNTVKRFYVPLIFFFNRSPGMALPLIALQYHEVKLHIDLSATVAGIDTSVAPEVRCFVDYVYLDTDERRRFAQVSHEYLIQQLQFTGDETVSYDVASNKSFNVRLNFNHPTRFLAWVFKGSEHGQYTAWPTGTDSVADRANLATYAEALGPMHAAKLQLNGHDRFSERRGSYFNLVQPWQTLRARSPAGVYMYSFSLKPDEHQPSGSVNFSRIDNATLNVQLKKAASRGSVGNPTPSPYNAANIVSFITDETQSSNNISRLTSLKIFAENYNVFRIMSGMGGLAYSN